MKARVRATGEIVTIMKNIGYPGGYVASDGRTYRDEDLTLIVDEEPDYWTKLEHQYAGMAMQGMLNNSYLAGEFRRDRNNGIEDMSKIITKAAAVYAHALVEKMKEERK